jgi:4-hydroxy-tetrahydrodipicolinate reductase
MTRFEGGIQTLHYGLGPIGCEIARVVLAKEGLRPVSAIDTDPEKVGKDLGEVSGFGAAVGVDVERPNRATLRPGMVDVALHATGSSLAQVMPQIEELVTAGISVVSTCEELAYPIGERVELANRIDELAHQHGATVLATGINPGFAMDTMAIAFSGVCQRIEAIRVTRVLDAAKRRLPFQRKVGVGLDPASFQELVEAGKVRHVGLLESLHMIAAAVGWQLGDTRESTEAIIANEELRTEYFHVRLGQIAGVRQVATGIQNGRPVIELDVSMYVGAQDSDGVQIEGTPNVDVVVRGGMHGDRCTAGIVVNAIPRVLSEGAGLVTMRDLPYVAATMGDVRRLVNGATDGTHPIVP